MTMPLSRPALLILAFGLAGLALAMNLRHGATTEGRAPRRPVRNAGRDEMTMPPRQWDRLDETLDASFPASDPAATY
ncbi:hypothetical protein ruthe_01456 [Rubellimicrobium thermophilum DSM 16684]|uniref:Uncharacterized protein n=1 Tax=Rubellimicrobium thermophilum DSM 16684 TaxID=1123069 RepID=S9R3T5_9RHOB|nr:hypothetical protein [Rubellimicrobium thermophilum]EPX86638.1 hypothetical protein ruthe_01456 [Rubellimicrobium thermophilum DSM 16684]